MRKLVSGSAIAAAMMAVLAVTGGPAAAQIPSAVAVSVADQTNAVAAAREIWTIAGVYNSQSTCEFYGATGRAAGTWSQWSCNFSDTQHGFVLWVVKNN